MQPGGLASAGPFCFGAMEPESYSNARDILASIIGQKIVDISQHDQEEWDRDANSYVILMFEDGQTLKIFVGETAMILNESELEEDA